MDQSQAKPAEPQDDVDALETPENSAGGEQVTDATGGGSFGGSPGASAPPPKEKKSFFKRFNIYLLFFVLLLVIAGVIVTIAYFQSKKAATTNNVKTQNLTQSLLQQVANSDTNVGSTQQVLNIESSAVFAGQVLLRDSLEVAGTLTVGGTSALTDLTVSGSTALGQVQISQDLSLAGNAGIQGAVTISKSLQVGGSANFSGPISAPQLTVGSLQLNNDLVLTHHFIAGGATPSRTNGTALGSGGTASVSGSDTAGSVTINTGSNPPAGCLITIAFNQKYNSTPHVIVTPIGSAAGSLAYYVDRNTADFSICDNNPAPSGVSFGFDYFVTD